VDWLYSNGCDAWQPVKSGLEHGMTEESKLHKPWLVAVWPGMGHVALTAGYYMMAKLGMDLFAEFSPRELFEMEYVEVQGGLIHAGRLPRSRLFAWRDPLQQHDIIVFIGEAQPSTGKYRFCHSLIDFTTQLGVERVFTFAAMATTMHPEHFSRVFGAATDQQGLDELKGLEIELLEEGHIGGLNGVLLGVAAERGLQGSCLLGEMPHIFSQLPFPKASLAVLRVFTSIAGIDLDTHELAEQARTADQNLGELLNKVENAIAQKTSPTEESDEFPEEPVVEDEPGLSAQDARKIEQLFEESSRDRTKAYELKQELDRMNVFKEYEDRFLTLFRKPESE
jgi:proteasome assembly chaperone (PAC2) family protein